MQMKTSEKSKLDRPKSRKCDQTYGCRFCQINLKSVFIHYTDLPWLLLLMRPFQCPHCFAVFIRPFAWIAGCHCCDCSPAVTTAEHCFPAAKMKASMGGFIGSENRVADAAMPVTATDCQLGERPVADESGWPPAVGCWHRELCR